MDWFAGFLTLASVFLFQRKQVFYANVVGLVAQVPWVLFIWMTPAWGLLPAEIAFTLLYAVGTWRSRKDCR